MTLIDRPCPDPVEFEIKTPLLYSEQWVIRSGEAYTRFTKPAKIHITTTRDYGFVKRPNRRSRKPPKPLY